MVLYSVCAFGMCFSLLGFLLLFVVTEAQSEFDEIWIILPSIKFVLRAGVVTVAEASEVTKQTKLTKISPVISQIP